MKQQKVKIVENGLPKKHVGLKSKPKIVHVIKKLIAGPSLFRSAQAKNKKQLTDLKRRMKLIASQGRANSGMCKFNHKKKFSHWYQVTFSSFNFADAVKDPLSIFKSGLLPRAEQDPITWEDGTNRIAKSAEGVDLVLHAPDFLRPRRHVCFYSYIFSHTNCIQNKLFGCLMQFGKAVKPNYGKAADKNKRDHASSYVHRPGQITGIVKLVTGWHAVGRTVSFAPFFDHN
jgi:hypothetical protein